jgi:peptidyl-prolyl cis-trans isomerase SurA
MYKNIKFLFLVFCGASALFSQNQVDGIAAIVGREIILKSEIEQHVQNYILQNRINVQSQPQLVQELRSRTIQSLIEQKLMIAQAEKDTITVEPEILDQRVDQRISYLIERVGSEDALEKAFRSNMKKIRKDTRKIVEEQLLVEKVRQEHFKDVKLSRREVENFYSTYKDSLPAMKETVVISHILKTVGASKSAQEEAFNKISEIKKRLDNGENFEELAKKYSQDPASAKKGGDLGLISRGDFVPAFETAAFALNDGEISDIVQTQFGYHIIQMIERRGEKIRTRHILIMVAPSDSDEQRTIAELTRIRDLALAGQPFDSLALLYSDDENVSKDKGLLGTFETSQLIIPEFKTVVHNLNVGEISEPFKTDFGYHIVKLEKKEAGRELSLDKDWQKIQEMANNFKLEKEYRNWIEELKKEVPIEIKAQS